MSDSLRIPGNFFFPSGFGGFTSTPTNVGRDIFFCVFLDDKMRSRRSSRRRIRPTGRRSRSGRRRTYRSSAAEAVKMRQRTGTNRAVEARELALRSHVPKIRKKTVPLGNATKQPTWNLNWGEHLYLYLKGEGYELITKEKITMPRSYFKGVLLQVRGDAKKYDTYKNQEFQTLSAQYLLHTLYDKQYTEVIPAFNTTQFWTFYNTLTGRKQPLGGRASGHSLIEKVQRNETLNARDHEQFVMPISEANVVTDEDLEDLDMALFAQGGEDEDLDRTHEAAVEQLEDDVFDLLA